MCFFVCVLAQTEKTDGEVKGDFVLSLALTAQTKTKSCKLHDLDHNLLPLACSLSSAETSGSSEGSQWEKVLKIGRGGGCQVLESESD